MNNPLVSIIIPHLWDRPLICLEAIKKQTYKNLEIIVEVDTRKMGPGEPRNRGVAAANGELYFFCDDDIELHPQCIEKMVKTLQDNPKASFAYCDYLKAGRLIGKEKAMPWDPEKLKKRNYISTMSMVRALDFPGFDITLTRYVDWDLWLQYAKEGKYGVHIPEPLFLANFGERGISMGGPVDRLIKTQEIKKKHHIDQVTYSIIVCFHNEHHLTEKCLESLVANTGEDFEIILVDDASTESITPYEGFIRATTYLRNQKREHHSKSCNFGAAAARGEYLIFLNNDTIVPRGWNVQLREAFDILLDVSCIGPLTSHSASCQEIKAFKNTVDLIDLENVHRVQETVQNRFKPLAIASKITGFCLFTSKKTWDKVGNFTESIPAGGNEAEWILRATEYGLYPYISTATYVHHYGNRSYQHLNKKELWEAGKRRIIDLHGKDALEWLEQEMYLKQYPDFERHITKEELK